jgi:hypothetical protein
MVMAAAWTACTKFEILQKRIGPGADVLLRGFSLLFGAFLKGVLKKARGNGWFFVVICVVKVWWKGGFGMVVFRG